MINPRNSFMAALIVTLAVSTAGCSSIQKLTGMGRDDTVLTGSREDAIPGKPAFPDPNDTLKPGASAGGTAQPPQGSASQDTMAQPAPDAAPATTPKPCKATDQKCKLAAAKAAKGAAAQQSGDVFSDPQQ